MISHNIAVSLTFLYNLPSKMTTDYRVEQGNLHIHGNKQGS